jgi:hypothetical protein
MNHSYLFEEGVWTSEGYFFDESQNRFPAEGKLRITHVEKFWISDGSTRLLEGDKREFHNKHEIIPFEKFNDYTTWRSQSSDLGAFSGNFVVADDAILSSFDSEKGNFSGFEFFIRLSRSTYKNRGCMFRGTTKISSWAMMLYKVE